MKHFINSGYSSFDLNCHDPEKLGPIIDVKMSEWFNVVYQQFIAMYDSGCQICCNWSRLKLGFKVPAHRSIMSQINMIPHPVTLNLLWAFNGEH